MDTRIPLPPTPGARKGSASYGPVRSDNVCFFRRRYLASLIMGEKEEPFLIRVHGELYDVRRFLKLHPGGQDAIIIGRGQDCTHMVHSYHPDPRRSLRVLEKYKHKFANSSSAA